MAAPEIFIYYRIAALHEPAVTPAVAQFQAALRSEFGALQTRLLRRHDGGDEELTLMEVYVQAAADADRLATSELLAAIEQAARVIAPWLLGERHIEVFEPCA
ncbi:DUF4936 family protein [Piscinibacter sakaiensis]|uniref:DUF4936 family protein n=1 Tax=Piscinibacter sakaiensis TaxID=1547922 RepID=UPI003AAF981F